MDGKSVSRGKEIGHGGSTKKKRCLCYASMKD